MIFDFDKHANTIKYFSRFKYIKLKNNLTDKKYMHLNDRQNPDTTTVIIFIYQLSLMHKKNVNIIGYSS